MSCEHRFWDTFHISFGAKAFGKKHLQQCTWVVGRRVGCGVAYSDSIRWAIFFYVFIHYLNCPVLSRNFSVNRNISSRFSNYVYDWIWSPLLPLGCEAKNTSYAIKSPDDNKYTFPSAIMQRAAVPINHSNPLVFYFQRDNPTNQFFLYMHFAEIGKLPANQTREFNIYVNNKLWHGPIVPT